MADGLTPLACTRRPRGHSSPLAVVTFVRGSGVAREVRLHAAGPLTDGPKSPIVGLAFTVAMTHPSG